MLLFVGMFNPVIVVDLANVDVGGKVNATAAPVEQLTATAGTAVQVEPSVE
jgi:hypothetical protein